MTYSMDDVTKVVGISRSNLNAYIHRRHVAFENVRAATRHDVFQVAIVQELHQAGVPLKRCPLFWNLIQGRADFAHFAMWVEERHDGSDTLFKLAYGPERPRDVPPTAHRIDVAAIHHRVNRQLDNLDATRITADPIAYPHRLPIVASHNPGASWSVFLQAEPGEPDAEAVARLAEAVEARSHVLLCGASMPALASLVQVADRMGILPQFA